MAGYLGQAGFRSSEAGTGFGFIARDKVSLEENDRGWENMPPWGYARNRAIDNAPPRGFVAGLGACCNGCKSGRGCMSGLGGDGNAAIETNAVEAANAYARALNDTGFTGTALDRDVRLPDFSHGDAYLRQVDDQNVAQAIQGYAYAAYGAIQNLIEYGDSVEITDVQATVQSSVAGLRSISNGQPVQQVAGDEWTDSTKSGEAQAYARKDDESIGWLQTIAMSDAGAGIIKAGAFTAGATGINKEAILEEGKRSDIDVGSLVRAGEKLGTFGKFAAYAAVGVGAYIVARKAGVL